ncbi:hypothetical protein DY000_02058736 [Brassica cretica]|uniref:Uncharacterized protein n=1 Tax=Brassica cretica TaxID=69181 RepID=A0ABQ7ATQ5_BRACR|nr:hypothetical protein DY000_02058736 [Brassica cretica]
MAQHQPTVQTKAEEHFVQIPVNIGRDSTTLVNPNRIPNHWPTILLSTIFAIIGQTIAKLLENFYYNKINRSDTTNAAKTTAFGLKLSYKPSDSLSSSSLSSSSPPRNTTTLL